MIERSLTASEEVLKAAANINKRKKEFTEWDITVETWKLNKQRWGLPGYESKFPDHKRVMNEIMAKGTQKKVIGQGWLQRIRQNYYTITQSGLAKVESLFSIDVSGRLRSLTEYDSISPYANHNIFLQFCKDPDKPKTWLGVAAFLKLKKSDKNTLEIILNKIKTSIESSLEWLEENNTDILRRDDSPSKRPITKSQLLKLQNFLVHIQEKFKAQFDAIRKND